MGRMGTMGGEADPGFLALTGASGHVGRLVLDALLALVPAGRIVAGTRTPDALADYAARGVLVRRADFDDADSLERAFDGAARVLLISSDAMPMERRAEQQVKAIGAAVATGARHIVSTAMTGATASGDGDSRTRGQADLMAALASCGAAWTALGMNIWMAGVPFFLGAFRVGDRLLVPEGTGRPCWIAQEDYTRVAAATLSGAARVEGEHDVTGPEALGLDDIARRWSAIHDRPLEPWILPADEVVERLVAKGAPKPAAEGMVAYCPLFGMFEVPVTDLVRRATGRAPMSVDGSLRGVV